MTLQIPGNAGDLCFDRPLLIGAHSAYVNSSWQVSVTGQGYGMFDPDLAEIRFGCGLSPTRRSAQSVDEMIARLAGPDEVAEIFPIPTFDSLRPRIIELNTVRRQRRSDDEAERKAAQKEIRTTRSEFNAERRRWLVHTVGRRATTTDGFRERLMAFWADHFTARASGLIIQRTVSPYWEEAIRPHLTGSFHELLISAVTHPLMLMFLNQRGAIGPNSQAAMNRKNKQGLNENLAREVMELHTLGVDGPYSQQDVRQLAELFTGLHFRPREGMVFYPKLSEPGAETILGKSYGGDPARLEDVHAALTDLARHPATAKHIAWKLAVHFVADDPDPGLVHSIAERFLETDGDLMETYRAMLEHPAAWAATLNNVKPPVDFVSSALRAFGVTPDLMKGFKSKQIRNTLETPLAFMGQPWDWPLGPDGWPEEDSHWVTPQAMATRMQWALVVPQILVGKLPDPRKFVAAALGGYAPEQVRFAAKAAESRWEGVALVLASPAFQRR